MSCQILVPLDGSSFGRQALPLAAAIAAWPRLALHLVKVHVPPPMKFSPQVFFDAQADQSAQVLEESYLNTLASSIRKQSGLRTHTAVLTGAVAPALEAYVRENDISLVIMSSHGRGGLSRVWLGSVADALVRNIDVPILIVKPNELEDERPQVNFGHILVPLDGSALAEEALVQAVALGDLFGARYTLLQVVNPPFALSAEASDVPAADYHKQVEKLRSAALVYLDELASPLRDSGAVVDTAVIVQTQSAPGILEEASYRNVDLIVMAAHGKSGYQRVSLGSVADKVLRGASTAVLMFRAHAAVPELAAAPPIELFV